MGIAEQNMFGTALGFAISGKIPIVSGFSMFTTGRAWEFIRLACHDNLNVKIITTHGGIVGEDGSTHNALEDLSLMASLPNLTILIPSDNIELIQVLKYALNHEGHYYIRLPRGVFPIIHEEKYIFKISELDLLKKGNDISLIGVGYCSYLSLKAASLIEKEYNISVKVYNLPTIKPINEINLLRELKDIQGVVVIEEHNIFCGVGSILARLISEKNNLPMRFIGVNNTFCYSGTREEVLDENGINLENILQKTEQLLKHINKI